MSVGALSPEAHQALTIGIQRAGGAANTGEGGEDPAWYAPGPDGRRHDARIKQVASARFGVTAAYLARADQLEIKIAQGSKPGEGGQLPGRKATAYIAALRRGQPGQSYISPPPHHDIYSIEDLAQLIADLRAINPGARIGVKLVAGRGVGTIAAGVAKAGASYIHLSGHAGGTGASPLSSIKHVGAPWELGLAEVHQVLLRNDLRDRVVLRTDGGLQTGRDLLVAALLGAEEFAFGTAALVGARLRHGPPVPPRHLPDRHRHPARGPARQVHRHARRRRAVRQRDGRGPPPRAGGGRGAVGRRGHRGEPTVAHTAPRGSGRTRAGHRRRAVGGVGGSPIRSRERRPRRPIRPGLGPRGRHRHRVPWPGIRHGHGPARDHGRPLVRGRAHRRPRARRPPRTGPTGATWLGRAIVRGVRRTGIELRLVGQANDYVGKGLSGGSVTIVPEPDLAATPSSEAIAGNTVLYGATGGRLHLVGRAGMRFAVRNSGAEAVVEGIGPHGCEYMTGGVVVVLGPGRRELRRRDDRRPRVPVRPGGTPRGRARRWQRRRPFAWPLCWPIGRMVRPASPSSTVSSKRTATPVRRLRRGSRDGDLPAAVWVVEPIAPPAAPVVATTREPAAAALTAIPIERSQSGVSAPFG